MVFIERYRTINHPDANILFAGHSKGGGLAADWKNIFNGKLFDENEYFGDDDTDHDYIKKGIEMFYEDYPEAKT